MDPGKKRFRVYLAVLLAIILLGAVAFSYLEKQSFTDALYFVVVTIATVGYGDIHPTTTPGKLTAVLLIITGVGIFLAVVANATDILLSRHEKRFRMQKQHVLLGIFFSEAGTELLRRFIGFDDDIGPLRQTMAFDADWPEKQFASLSQMLDEHSYDVDANKESLVELRDFLESRGNLLLRLLESPYLLEHESFTDLLRAIFHLREELLNRKNLRDLPLSDYQHLSGDINRAYRLLARHWLEYLHHLKELFPYLFSLAVRMNPFDSNSSPVVR